MDRCNDFVAEEDLLNPNVQDDALERAAGLVAPVFTINYCTYDFYQCGPIGDRP